MDPTAIIQMMTNQLRYLQVDVKEVSVISKLHKSREQKQCYNNTYKAMSSNSLYVLGYLLFSTEDQVIPLEHAWYKDGDTYFDATLDSKPADTYISIVELSYSEVCEYVDDYSHAPDLYSMNRFLGNKSRK